MGSSATSDQLSDSSHWRSGPRATLAAASVANPASILASSESGLIALGGIWPAAMVGWSSSGSSSTRSRSVTRFCGTERRSATPLRVRPRSRSRANALASLLVEGIYSNPAVFGRQGG